MHSSLRHLERFSRMFKEISTTRWKDSWSEATYQLELQSHLDANSQREPWREKESVSFIVRKIFLRHLREISTLYPGWKWCILQGEKKSEIDSQLSMEWLPALTSIHTQAWEIMTQYSVFKIYLPFLNLWSWGRGVSHKKRYLWGQQGNEVSELGRVCLWLNGKRAGMINFRMIDTIW